VAYRRFFTLACLVCGLTAAGCGGGAGTASRSTTTTTDDTPTDETNPPANRDQAPINKDQPPRSADQATSGSPGASPSGGGPLAACQAFCAEQSGAGGCLGDNLTNMAVRAVCASGCMLDEQQAACQAEAVAAFNCIMGLPGVCTTAGPADADIASCQQSGAALKSCQDAHKPAEMPTGMCNMAGGCQCGDDECKACQCFLGDQSATCSTLCN
jgi:hypothetical protein